MSIKSKLATLLANANAVTGKEDTTLLDAVKSLSEGFGKAPGLSMSYVEDEETGRYTVEFSDGWDSVYERCFYTDSKIYKVILPDSVKMIGEQAFYGSSIRLMDFSDEITNIRANAFQNCYYLVIDKLPEKIQTIENYAFSGCEEINFTNFPNNDVENLTVIPKEAFSGCNMLELTVLPKNITSIETNAFINCNQLKLEQLPENLSVIGDSCFQYCKEMTISLLPNNLITIGSSSFASCKKISFSKIPASISKIGNYAFRDCGGLTTIIFEKKITLENSIFVSCPNLTEIKVPWSEGEVAGAPWGATNATITYDYTEE